MARIVVAGYMIRHPVAGNLLAYFHYLLGLCRLGHEVFYIEESGWPNACYDPESHDCGEDPSAGLRAVRDLLATYDIRMAVCYVNRHSGNVEGGTWDDIKRRLQTSDLLLNVGGVCWLDEFRLCRRRALIDMDPFFTQLGRFSTEGFNDHQVFFSYGLNIGRPDCGIPTRGVEWLPTVPPVVPQIWQAVAARPGGRPETVGGTAFTTIANWNSYGPVTYRGERYGQKDEEFLRLRDLPRHTAQSLELALSGISAADREPLQKAGWLIRGTSEISTTLSAYQAYIAGSRGEFSVAKNAYVKTRSGWFSDRSVCYLASGKPVLVQDTGIKDHLPTGEGLLTFRNLSEGLSGIEQINADYEKNCRAARSLAEQYFAADRVLPPLLRSAMD